MGAMLANAWMRASTDQNQWTRAAADHVSSAAASHPIVTST